MSTNLEILVASGPLVGRRFAITEGGLRLGRSSSCEIAISDPALSRNHCLFELRSDGICVTDLASANGTIINGEMLGADSKLLSFGDEISVGDSILKVVESASTAVSVATDAAPDASSAAEFDLGLGQDQARDGEPCDNSPQASTKRFILWIGALLAVAGTSFVILSDTREGSGPAVQSVPDEGAPVLRALTYEKVEADDAGIYRSAISYDLNGELSVEIDDVPKENRHLTKSQKLSDKALEELSGILSDEDLYKLDREYTGVPLKQGALKSYALRIVRGNKVFSINIENAVEPSAFKSVRERLETFSKNELGIWAVQYSKDKLIEMSADSRRVAEAKWRERDVQYGNISEALAAYREAVFYLETVNPKPSDYGELVAKRDEVAAELDKRYRDQRFLADRAINLGDWRTAQRELRILCELVPDAKDSRHSEASAKLLDVESRIKKGDK